MHVGAADWNYIDAVEILGSTLCFEKNGHLADQPGFHAAGWPRMAEARGRPGPDSALRVLLGGGLGRNERRLVSNIGSTSIQGGALRAEDDLGSPGSWVARGTTITSNVKVVYVPHANAHGADSFQYQANDCTGDIFRVSAPGTISISIEAINDVPTLAVDTLAATTNADEAIDFGVIVDDVETVASELVIDITSLPTGTESQFYDGTTPVSPSALPHRLTNALKVLSFRFDSLAGLETSALPEGELLRTTAATYVSFTATDPDGGVLASTVRLQLYAATFSCVAEDHEVVFEGEEPVCTACRPGVAASPGSPTCDICAEGFFRLSAADDASSCVRCPETVVSCPRDATLETMELSAGWWRASNQSAEWHWCGETPGYVRFLLLPWLEGNSPSPGNRTDVKAQSMCLGGADGGETSCAPTHLGPLCRSCNSSYYFDEADLECKVCPDGGSVTGVIALVLVVCAILVILFRQLQGYFTKAEPRAGASKLVERVDGCLRFLSKQLHNINAMCSSHLFMPSLKLIIAYCQVVYAVPAVYDVTMPDSYYRALDWLDFFTFQWLLEVGIDPECVGGGGLATQLAVFGLVPFGVMLALPFVAICVEKLAAAFTGQASGGSKRIAAQNQKNQWTSRVGLSFLRTLPLSLFIAFISVISVSHRVFSAFDCLEFETDSLSDPKTSLHYVNSDLTLRCDASVPAYKEATDLAYTLIALWPVAMPLAFALTLFSVRNKLLKRRGTQLTRATNFLHKEYEPLYFWWESLVLVQRLALTGWNQLVPGHMALLRIILGLFVSFTYTMLLLICKPVRRSQPLWTLALAIPNVCFAAAAVHLDRGRHPRDHLAGIARAHLHVRDAPQDLRPHRARRHRVRRDRLLLQGEDGDVRRHLDLRDPRLLHDGGAARGAQAEPDQGAAHGAGPPGAAARPWL